MIVIRIEMLWLRKIRLTDKENQGNLEMMLKTRRVVHNTTHTPWLTERISCVSWASVSEFAAVKWKAAGKSTAMTLIVNREEFSWVAPIIGRYQQLNIKQGTRDQIMDLTYWHQSLARSISNRQQRSTCPEQVLVWPIWTMNIESLEIKMTTECLRRLLRIDPTTVMKWSMKWTTERSWTRCSGAYTRIARCLIHILRGQLSWKILLLTWRSRGGGSEINTYGYNKFDPIY